MPDGYIGTKLDTGFWTEQVSKAIEYRKKAAYMGSWDKWRSYYRGDWSRDVQPSNIFFKMQRTIVPRIYFRNPAISVKSDQPGWENQVFARVLQRVDNKLFRQMKLKGQVKKIVDRAFQFGTGVGKLGFGAQYDPNSDEAAPPGKGNLAKIRNTLEYHSLVKENMPWFMSVHPGMFLVPAGCAAIEEARWVGHWVRRPTTDLKEDKRFKGTDNLTSSKGESLIDDGGGRPWAISENLTDLVEIRDKKTGEAFVMSPYAGDEGQVLLRGSDPLQYDGDFPFYPLVFNPDDEYFWGIPDSKILEPIQLDLNETRTQLMKHRRATIVKMLADKGAMTEEEAEKMVSEDVKSVAFTTGPPARAIHEITSGGIPQELFSALDLGYTESREIVGFSRNEFGEFKPGSHAAPTASEVAVVAQAAGIRIDERRDSIADMLTEVATDMHQIVFDKWREEFVVDILGPNGAPVWVAFRGDMLRKGTFTVSVDPESSTPQTRDVREAKAIQAYGLMREDPLFDQTRVRQNLLAELQGAQYDDLMSDNAGGNPENPMEMAQLIQMFQQGGGGPQGGGQQRGPRAA